jgi:hypothetical protein
LNQFPIERRTGSEFRILDHVVKVRRAGRNYLARCPFLVYVQVTKRDSSNHSLWRVVSEFLQHYHQERNHQGKGNLLLFSVLLRKFVIRRVRSAVESGSVAYLNTNAGCMTILTLWVLSPPATMPNVPGASNLPQL